MTPYPSPGPLSWDGRAVQAVGWVLLVLVLLPVLFVVILAIAVYGVAWLVGLR